VKVQQGPVRNRYRDPGGRGGLFRYQFDRSPRIARAALMEE